VHLVGDQTLILSKFIMADGFLYPFHVSKDFIAFILWGDKHNAALPFHKTCVLLLHVAAPIA
jgi:hypothetical protein